MAWNGVPLQFYAAQTLGNPFRLLAQEGLLADELFLVEFHEH